MAASRQRDIAAEEGELWEMLRLDAERAAAGEEMLRGFLDLAVLSHNAFASGLGNGSAVVVLEPDALAQIACLSSQDQNTRLSLLGYARAAADWAPLPRLPHAQREG